MGRYTFRLMDPVSQQMMGLRADITMQIARIAASRLTNSPRPLAAVLRRRQIATSAHGTWRSSRDTYRPIRSWGGKRTGLVLQLARTSTLYFHPDN